MLEHSQVTTSDPGQLLGKLVGDHDVDSSFVDVSDDTLDGVVDFLGVGDSLLLWVEFSDGPNGVSPATTTDEIVFKSTCHVAVGVGLLSVFTEFIAHEALTTILVTNVLEALSLGFSEAVCSGYWLVVVDDGRKISLPFIFEATKEFGAVTEVVSFEGGVVVVDLLDNRLCGLPDFGGFLLVGFGPSAELD